MRLLYTPYIWPLIATAFLTVASTIVALRRRQVAGAKSLASLTAALTWWLVCYAFQISGKNLQTLLFWSNVTFLSIAFVPVFWVAFAIEYSGYGRWFNLRNGVLLSIVPVITQIVIWADPVLHLFRTEIQLVVSDSLLTMRSTWGPWFWVHTVYSYVLILLGLVLLGRLFIRTSGLYKRQAGMMLVGASVAMSANILFVFVFKQVFVLDPTPFSFALTSITFALSLFRFRLLDVVPLARDAVIEGMHDGVLVLDMQNRIVDLNPVAQKSLGCTVQQVIGQSVRDVFPEYGELLAGDVGAVKAQSAIMLETLEGTRYYDLNLSPLYSRQQHLIGRLVVLHDITERKQAEQALEHWLAQFQILPELAREIAAAQVLDELLLRSANLLRERFDAYHVGVFLVEESGYARLRAASGAAAKALLAREAQWDLENVVGQREMSLDRLIRGGETLHRMGEEETGMIYGYEPLLSQARSEVMLPLRLGPRVIGALLVQSIEARPFAENALAILQTVADQLAVAVENARLVEQMSLAMREMERTSGQYTEQAWRGLTEDKQPLGYRYRREVVEPILDPASFEGTMKSNVAEPIADRDVLDVPITLRGQTIGTLHLHFPERQVASNVEPLVQAVASRLALTLESARLYEDTQRSAARERMTREITGRMRETLDLETVLQTAAREIRAALQTPEVVVRLSRYEDTARDEDGAPRVSEQTDTNVGGEG